MIKNILLFIPIFIFLCILFVFILNLGYCFSKLEWISINNMFINIGVYGRGFVFLIISTLSSFITFIIID